jgi:hypothetical protein
MMAGAAFPLLLLGAVDWISWGAPFISLLNNLQFNLIDGRSSVYGTAHPLWYLAAFVIRWDMFALPALALIGLAALRKPSLLLITLVIFVSYSLIPHKEYRFILPALTGFAVLAGLGLAEIIRRIASDAPRAERLLCPLALLIWLAGTLSVALSADGQKRLTAGRNGLEAFAALQADPTLCGLAFDAGEWVEMPGLSALHRPVPLYLWSTLNGDSGPANVMLRAQSKAPEPGFRRGACFAKGPWPALCLDRRDGMCAAAPDRALNAELIRRGQ